MKLPAIVVYFSVLSAMTAPAADKKAFPGQAGNDNIELTGTLMIDPAQIRDAVGSDLGPGIVVARVKASNKTGDPMRIGPDDFSLLSHKDGDRGDALAPAELAGGSALIVKRDTAPRGWAHITNQPGYTGVGGMSKADKPVDQTLLAALKSKEMPDQETKPNGSVEGLLYFSMESAKLKLKDLALTYKGAGGHLSMEFK
jgi:hypothetical protein